MVLTPPHEVSLERQLSLMSVEKGRESEVRYFQVRGKSLLRGQNWAESNVLWLAMV